MKANQTVKFKNTPSIIGSYSIVGPKEGKGNFGKYFNQVIENDGFGEKSYERAEKKMLETAINGAIEDAKIKPNDVNLLLSGDLLNQIISSSYAARNFNFAFLGLFGACSTMAESMAIGASLVDGGLFETVCCSTGSHFSTAERQFRFPLELGNQRPPTSQWTVTGAGACIITAHGKGPKITMATFGKVIDFGVNDVNDMGAVMAPAAMNTMLAHFRDTNSTPDDYDLIVTGDLGKLCSEILVDLMEDEGIKLGLNYNDCGQMYFTRNQNTLSGGSGCGCSATVFNSFIMKKLRDGEYRRVLFMPTGALMSPTASQQGETIPAICHAVVVESEANHNKAKNFDMKGKTDNKNVKDSGKTSDKQNAENEKSPTKQNNSNKDKLMQERKTETKHVKASGKSVESKILKKENKSLETSPGKGGSDVLKNDAKKNADEKEIRISQSKPIQRQTDKSMKK